MNRKIFRFASLVLWFVSLAAGSIAESALACNTPPAPTQPPPPVTIRKKSPTRFKIRVKGYTTFGVGVGQRCACGQRTAGLGTIVSVDSVRVVRAGTNTLVPGFSFTPNQTTTDGFNALQAGSWQGFLSVTDTAVPEGIQTDLIFDVTAVPGSTFNDVAAEVTGGAFGTAPANADGTLDLSNPNHVGLADPGAITEELFAYTANSGSANSTFYLHDATNGPLSPGSGSPFPLQGNPNAVAFGPVPTDAAPADWVVFLLSLGFVEVGRVDRDTGVPTQAGPPPVPSGGINPVDILTYLILLQGDAFIGVANAGSNNVATFRLNQSSGALTLNQTVNTGPAPQNITPYNIGGQLYLVTANCGSPNCDGPGSVSKYAADPTTGMLTEVPGSPFPTGGIGTVWVATNSTGTLGFTANARSNNISLHVIDPITGAWSLQGTFDGGGIGPSSVAVDPSDQFLIVTNLGSNSGSIFAINPDNTLTLTSTFPTGTNPFSVKFSPGTNPIFYVANPGSGNVSGFAFNNVTGTATPTLGSPYPAGPFVTKLAWAVSLP